MPLSWTITKAAPTSTDGEQCLGTADCIVHKIQLGTAALFCHTRVCLIKRGHTTRHPRGFAVFYTINKNLVVFSRSCSTVHTIDSTAVGYLQRQDLINSDHATVIVEI